VRRALAAGLCALLVVAPSPALAEKMALPADKQVPLLLKILTYDRQFEQKAGSEVVIGIVYSAADPDSAPAMESLSSTLNGFAGKTVKKLPIKYWQIPYSTPDRLEAIVKEKGINVLYVCPGNDRNLAAIVKLAQGGRITTLTGIPDYVKKGVAVGVGERSGKPQIFINLDASKAEGSDFDASLLRIAEVVR
jgi:hypothetical protein